MEHQTSRRTFLTGLGAAAAVAATGVPAVAAPGALSTAATSAGQRRSAATVLHNGVIFTGLPHRPPARALAIGRDGLILDVGTDAEIRRHVGRDTEVVDLRGGFVMPGLHDGHVHLEYAGAGLEAVSFGDAELTLDQLRAVLTAALAATASLEPDGWLQVSDWGSTGALPDGTLVTRQHLDVLDTRRPIFIRSGDLHHAWVNSRALELAGIDASRPDPAGGVIVRDAAGVPTGVLHDSAVLIVEDAIPDLELSDLVRQVSGAHALLLAAGVTTVLDAGARDLTARIHEALHAAGQLTLRTHLAYWLKVGEFTTAEHALAELAAFKAAHGGIDRMPIRTAKIFLDGVMEHPAQTAALLQPYLVDGAPGTNLGTLNFGQANVTALALALDAAGWQLHTHSIGDRAVRTAVTAFEDAARQRRPGQPDNRHTLAHVELFDPADFSRAARAGVVACMQLQWAETDPFTTDLLLPYIGPQRQSRIYPARTMLDAGIRLAGGTDWPIDAFNPWRPVEQAITRAARDGSPALNPAQSLTRFEALSMHTAGTAYQLHQEHRSGTLEPGKYADLVHTDRDLLRVDPHEIHATRAVFTMIGGEVVHDGSAPATASTAAAEALLATGARPAGMPHRPHRACGCDAADRPGG